MMPEMTSAVNGDDVSLVKGPRAGFDSRKFRVTCEGKCDA